MASTSTSVGAAKANSPHPELAREKSTAVKDAIGTTKATQAVAATLQAKAAAPSAAGEVTTSVQPKPQPQLTKASPIVSGAPKGQANAPTTLSSKVATPAPSAAKREPEEKPAVTQAASSSLTASELEPSLADLWVVSYGDDDDRELTEKQVVAELARGNISLSTIVWHEGMPEWLPISGVKELAKHAPSPKAVAKTSKPKSAVPQPRAAAPQASNSLTAKSTAQTPTAAPTTARELASSPQSPSPEQRSNAAVADASAAAATLSRKPSPPPLPKSGVTHERPVETETRVGSAASFDAEPAANVAEVPKAKAGARPPALPSRGQEKALPTAPWELADAEPVEDVFTSAPDVGALRAPASEPRPSGPAAGFPTATPARSNLAAMPAPAAAPAAVTLAAKVSVPPPKPVETATSMVMRTDASPGGDALISDAEFLAMQRRFPKWALAAIGVAAVGAIAGVIVLLQSKEELPPLPVAPVVTVSPTPSGSSQDSPLARKPNPSVAAPVSGASSAAAADEKDFARLFAQSVGKATGGFDPKAAETAAASGLEAASRCRYAPDVPGRAQVVVTFATSGQVLSVQVAPPYTTSATGKCVVAALQAVRITPFQGRPGRLSLVVPLH